MAKVVFISLDGEHATTRVRHLDIEDRFRFFRNDGDRRVTKILNGRMYYRGTWGSYEARHSGIFESVGANSMQIVYLIKQHNGTLEKRSI